ncbi:(d)CMP kinase [Buchnera aphidicola]|uniref:Cytidylate kinase n=1 Tax=Buchnera aphidicola (Artemisaphis artemisicola) TaxID=1241836 RepID=A0A4D6XT75_9GAMM|nr:(d)CMP kinase [Buchnera aphidicola]QCI15985.1 (d)CMP kinase [Buchnera aphidicola (Artemisaphis artemisicola)]
MINKVPVITIDGPSGVGKSTISKIVADRLNWFLLESGKIYRLVAFLALNNKISLTEKSIISLIKDLDIITIKKKINCLHSLINIEKISEFSSHLATYPNIRNILLEKQRLLRCMPGLIAEGRDMGSVVFPDAKIKFFLNAHLKIRVQRRISEINKHNKHVNFKELYSQMKNRDKRDQNRLISPLCIPKNAIILDSTHMSLSETTKNIIKYVIKKIKHD